jgi:hypothetical protein
VRKKKENAVPFDSRAHPCEHGRMRDLVPWAEGLKSVGGKEKDISTLLTGPCPERRSGGGFVIWTIGKGSEQEGRELVMLLVDRPHHIFLDNGYQVRHLHSEMYIVKSYKRRGKTKERSHGLITRPGQHDPLFD